MRQFVYSFFLNFSYDILCENVQNQKISSFLIQAQFAGFSLFSHFQINVKNSSLFKDLVIPITAT